MNELPKNDEQTSAAMGTAETAAPSEPPVSGGDKIERALSKLVTDVNSIIFALNSLEETMLPRLEETSKSLNSFFTKHKDSLNIKKIGNEYQFEMPRDIGTELMSVVKKRVTVETGNATIRKAIMLALVSHWDVFISSLLEALYEIHPNIVDSSGRSLTRIIREARRIAV